MLHFRCSMNWKHQQLSQLLCQICRFLMELISMYSFPCHWQSEPPAPPGIFAFASGDSNQQFAKCQFLPSSEAPLQTNEGHQVPKEGLSDMSSVLSCQTHVSCWLSTGRTEQPQLQESLGNKPANQTKPRLAAPLEAYSQMFLKQEHLAVSWRAQKPLLSPVAASFPACCPEQPFITVIQ